MCSVRKVFFNALQNSSENNCVGVSFLIKLKALLKKDFNTVAFLWMFQKFYEHHLEHMKHNIQHIKTVFLLKIL